MAFKFVPYAPEGSGGSGSGSGIIDVTELPTENIDNNAVYRLTTEESAGAEVYMCMEGMFVPFAEFFYLMTDGQITITTRTYVVDELPATLEPFDQATLILPIYIVKSTGIGYISNDGTTVVPLSMMLGEDDPELNKGWTDDISSIDSTNQANWGFYAVGSSDNIVCVTMHTHKNGEWRVHKEIIDVTELPEADVNGGALYELVEVVADVDIYVYANRSTGSPLMTFEEFAKAGGVPSIEVKTYLVDEIPPLEDMESVVSDDTSLYMPTYVLESTGICYVKNQDGELAPLSTFINPNVVETVDKGWCDDLTAITEQGVYTVRNPDDIVTKGLYSYSGKWDRFVPGSIVEDIENENKILKAKYEATEGCVTDVGASNFLNYATLTSTDDGVTISEITDKTITEIKIPDSVTSMAPGLFQGCNSLATVTFGENSRLTEIPIAAFGSCRALTSINIPDSVTSIGRYAFQQCRKLEAINFSESSRLNKIDENAFEYCSSLTAIDIPDGVTRITGSTFYNCKALSAVNFNESSQLTEIEDGAFDGCEALQIITIPPKVASVGAQAFRNCKAISIVNVYSVESWCNIKFLGNYTYSNPMEASSANPSLRINGLEITEITLPEDITAIPAYTFNNCASIVSIVIPDSVTSIGSYAFNGCKALTSIDIPDSVTTIGDFLVRGCSNLKSINFGENPKITKIPQWMFEGCSALTSIVIPDSVTSIGGYAFYNCSALTSVNIPDGIVGIAGSTFQNCASLTSIAIPDSVTGIGSAAFSGCSGLTAIAIPDSVTNIGNSAFSGCSGLTSITVDSGNTAYHSAGNCLIETVSKTVILGCANSVIPDDGSVTSIGNSAFRNCSGLTSIVIPDSVTSIGSSAFSGCSGLTSITVDSGNTVYHSAGNCLIETASKTVLLGCANSIIPDDGSVTSIGSSAFYNCSALTSIAIPDSVTSIGGSAFSGCSGLTSIAIPDSVTSIADSVFNGCSGLTSITVDSGNTVYHSAGNCLIETASKTVILGCANSVIPDDGSVTSIGAWAFQYCSALTSITIPDSVTNIDSSAFQYCSALTSIDIPGSVKNIENYAFAYCPGLTSITIPNGIKTIKPGVFRGCLGLTSIIIPDSVTYIDSWAFYECNNVGYIDFSTHSSPPGVTVSSFPETCEIRVPVALVDTWKAASNWYFYASQIVGV